jgi:hypothetical protein
MPIRLELVNSQMFPSVYRVAQDFELLLFPRAELPSRGVGLQVGSGSRTKLLELPVKFSVTSYWSLSGDVNSIADGLKN